MTLPETVRGWELEDFPDWLGQGRDGLRKGERTRLDLLLAGAHFLGDHCLDTLTVAAICQHAGVAHGTFYLYFKDRNDLAGTLLGRFVDFLQIQMRSAARHGSDPLRDTTAAYYALFSANAGLMKCLVMGVDAFPEAREAFQRFNQEWARTVVRAMNRTPRQAQAPDDELMRRAYALGGMVDQYLTALFVTKDPWLVAISREPEAVIATLADIWMKGMQT
ncbi:TetR family transcriptional regulator [Rhodobacterales bacterium HKCCSP123]|nr:TetR family transcriptional regulator [Rhodobacterales bacterium HKCCSP123]